MLRSASLTQCSSCDKGFADPTNQHSLRGLWLRLSPKLWLPAATVLIHALQGECRDAFSYMLGGGGVDRIKAKPSQRNPQKNHTHKKTRSQRDEEECFHLSIHPSIHRSREDERKFKVKIHLPSMRVAGGSTYCTEGRAEGSTLASRYRLLHMLISFIQIDGWRLGRRAIRSINLGLLCSASEQVAHMRQPPPQKPICEANRNFKHLVDSCLKL